MKSNKTCLKIILSFCRFQLRSDKQNMMNRKMILPTARYFVAIAKLKFNFATCTDVFVCSVIHVDHTGCRDIKMQHEQLLYRVYSHFQPWVYVYYNFHFQLPVLFFNSPGLWWMWQRRPNVVMRWMWQWVRLNQLIMLFDAVWCSASKFSSHFSLDRTIGNNLFLCWFVPQSTPAVF